MNLRTQKRRKNSSQREDAEQAGIKFRKSVRTSGRGSINNNIIIIFFNDII